MKDTTLDWLIHILSQTTELISNKWRETRKWSSTPRHVVHYDLPTVQVDLRWSLGFRIRVAWIISHRLLALPRLSQSVVDVCVMIHKRSSVWPDAFVFTLRLLKLKKLIFRSLLAAFKNQPVNQTSWLQRVFPSRYCRLDSHRNTSDFPRHCDKRQTRVKASAGTFPAQPCLPMTFYSLFRSYSVR